MNNNEFSDIIQEITTFYETGISIPEAERLATKLLCLMAAVAEKLKEISLDARMKKTGVKAVKSSLYLREVKSYDKKPSDSLLENVVNSDPVYQNEQNSFDSAEVMVEYYENYMMIFKEAHIHFRAIGRGKYE